MNTRFYKLMLVTDRKSTPIAEYLEFIRLCVSAGITSVQLREKNTSYQTQFEFGLALKNLLTPFGVSLIVNDNILLACELDADGVHLGQTDGDPLQARKILGPQKIIGVSIESEEELETANTYPLDYVAASAVFETKSKSNLKKIWGLEGLEALSSKSTHPLIGIGGIDETNLASVLAAGARGVAIIGALHNSNSPAHTTQHMCEIIDKMEKHHA